MRILCIDYGSVRHGLAVSDLLGITAQPLESFTRVNETEDIIMFRALIEEKEVARIVIGLPVNMDGSKAVHYDNVIAYKELLEKEFGLEVDTWDERLTTAQAERMLIAADTSRKKRKKVVDKLASTLILQNYMDANPQIIEEIRNRK